MVVTSQAPIFPDLRYGWHVPLVMEAAGLAAPLHGQNLLSFLEIWVHAYDQIHDSRRKANSGSFQSQSEPWRRYAQSRFLEGATTPEVRAELLAQFGVELSKSNASHMRRRTMLLVMQ